MIIVRFATVKKTTLDSYQLEVVCETCRSRGILWFNKLYKISAHSCPKCHKKTLQTPEWLNKYKMTSVFLNKSFK